MRIYTLFQSAQQPKESTQNNFTKAYFFTHKDGEDFKALECLSDECFGTINEFKVVHYEEAKQKALDLGFIKLDSFNLSNLGISQDTNLNQNDLNNISNATLSAGISFLMKFAESNEQAQTILNEAFQQEINIPLSNGSVQKFTIYQLSEIQKQTLQNKLKLEEEQNKQLEDLKNENQPPQTTTDEENGSTQTGDNGRPNGDETESNKGESDNETTEGSIDNGDSSGNDGISGSGNPDDLQTSTDSTTSTGTDNTGTTESNTTEGNTEVEVISPAPTPLKDLPFTEHPSDWNEILELSDEELTPRLTALFNIGADDETKANHDGFNSVKIVKGLIDFKDNSNSGNNFRITKNSKEQNIALAKLVLRKARQFLDPLVYGYFDATKADTTAIKAFKTQEVIYNFTHFNYQRAIFINTLLAQKRLEEALWWDCAIFQQGSILTAVKQTTANVKQTTANQIWYARNVVYDYAAVNDGYNRHAKQRFAPYVTAGLCDIVDKASYNRFTREYITEDTMQFLDPETLAYIMPTKGR